MGANPEQTREFDARGPEWDIRCEYASFEDPRFLADLAELGESIIALKEVSGDVAACVPDADKLDPTTEKDLLIRCGEGFERWNRAATLLDNLSVYVNCVLSVDGGDAAARKLDSEMDRFAAELGQAADPLELFSAQCSDEFLRALLGQKHVAPYAFALSRKRKRRDRMLSLEAEGMLKSMGVDGFVAWGSLYTSIASTSECVVRLPEGERRMGIAQASGLLRKPDRKTREAAWRGIGEAYSAHDQSLAAILNSLAGWRLGENRLRSGNGPVSFLDSALDQNNMDKATLDAMFKAVDESRETGRRALRAQAKACGIPALAPWDLLAPPPESRTSDGGARITFDEGLAMVRDAFAAVDPRMGQFVEMAKDRGWIEGRSLRTKRPGAFCTGFEKSRTPRVYMTFLGSLEDVGTLAHELGHAYHSWVMRDLHRAETSYPMTLAETASTFAEAVLAEWLSSGFPGEAGEYSIAWSKAQDAATFLLNIPARFDFERNFYEARSAGTLQAEDLTRMMEDSWKKYYGDSLSCYDGSFWKSKLHFYKTGISFYNFPYTFGFLFSMGVCARRKDRGSDFFDSYRAMLMDTGRMGVEELASRHLGVDVTDTSFWKAGIDLVTERVERFERLA